MDDGSKLKKILLGSFIGSTPFFLMLFVIFIVVLFMLGIINTDNGSSSIGGGGSYSKECGFTISKTSLTKGQFASRVALYAQENPNFQIFADNAEEIYKTAVSMNVNPELVVVRAEAEGHATTTGSYNYWGIGCNNGEGISACHSYDDFEEGYIAYLTNIEQYSSLADMMSKYAYIGDYWYKPGSSADGGCYYAPYIYPDLMPGHVEKACGPTAPICTTAGEYGCTPTTDADQEAYATWQVEKNMATIRKDIFGLEFDEGPCVYNYGNFQALSSYTLNGEGLKELDRKLTESEVEKLNNYINKEVDKAGYGTGAGVAAAGQALVHGLEQLGYKLPYFWGGAHYWYYDKGNFNFVGVNPNWGGTDYVSDHGDLYYGMDCSGFTTWAIRTGCTTDVTIGIEVNVGDKPVIDITEAKPGDLVAYSSGGDFYHIELVVLNNGDGTIITAQAANSKDDVIFSRLSSGFGGRIYDMSAYYAKACGSSRNS